MTTKREIQRPSQFFQGFVAGVMFLYFILKLFGK